MMRILSIEDSRDDFDLLLIAVGNDVELSHATTVRAALNVIDRWTTTAQPFDAIMLDMCLPEIRGIAAIEAILASTKIPIFVYTGSGNDDLETRALELGVRGWIQKGATGAEILVALHSGLAAYYAEHAMRRSSEASSR